MKRDPYSTVTGWRWLDRLTLPFWAGYCRIQEWRYFKTVGNGNARRGRQMLRAAARTRHPSSREVDRG